MKKKVLIIFKYLHVWNSAEIDKFYNKFFIIIESIVNAFWYSFILTFKSKK